MLIVICSKMIENACKFFLLFSHIKNKYNFKNIISHKCISFSPGSLASPYIPETCKLRVRWLIGHSELPIGVNGSVDGCLSLYVSPVMNWRLVQTDLAFAQRCWDSLQSPCPPNISRRWMDGCSYSLVGADFVFVKWKRESVEWDFRFRAVSYWREWCYDQVNKASLYHQVTWVKDHLLKYLLWWWRYLKSTCRP